MVRGPAIRCVTLRDPRRWLDAGASRVLADVQSDQLSINDTDTYRRGERRVTVRTSRGEPMMRRSQQSSAQSRMMVHPFLMASLLVLFLAANLTGAISSQLWPVVVAAAAGVFCIIECRLAGLSWAHPRILILSYVVLACSIPPVYLHLQPYSDFAQTFRSVFKFLVSPETPVLMAFTILATGIGLSLQSYQPRKIVAPPEGEFEREDEPQAIKRHQIGQVVLSVVSLSLLFQGVTTGAAGRGPIKLSSDWTTHSFS